MNGSLIKPLRKLMHVVQRRANAAAQATKAFESAIVTATNADGTVEVDVPGAGTRTVPRQSIRVPTNVGQEVTISRLGGQVSVSFASGRSAYKTAPEQTVGISVPH